MSGQQFVLGLILALPVVAGLACLRLGGDDLAQFADGAGVLAAHACGNAVEQAQAEIARLLLHQCRKGIGVPEWMASGKPVKPSTRATNTSFSPRFCSAVNADSQNLAPSASASHRPRTSLWPAKFTPSATCNVLFNTRLS